MTYQTSQLWTDRPERRTVDLRGFALAPQHDADIVLSDLSYRGCQIRSDECFTPGEYVELRIIKLGRAFVQIRWATEGQAGARFVA